MCALFIGGSGDGLYDARLEAARLIFFDRVGLCRLVQRLINLWHKLLCYGDTG